MELNTCNAVAPAGKPVSQDRAGWSWEPLATTTAWNFHIGVCTFVLWCPVFLAVSDVPCAGWSAAQNTESWCSSFATYSTYIWVTHCIGLHGHVHVCGLERLREDFYGVDFLLPLAGANAQWVGRSSRLTAFNARACQPGASGNELCAIVIDVISK